MLYLNDVFNKLCAQTTYGYHYGPKIIVNFQPIFFLMKRHILLAMLVGCGIYAKAQSDKDFNKDLKGINTKQSPVQDLEQQHTLNDMVDTWHKAAAQADSSTYFGAFASDESVFEGTDGGEYWTISAFQKWAAPYFKRGNAWTFSPVERRWYSHSGVLWFSERLDSEHMGRCRGTGVVIKTLQGYKIDHYSLSFEVPNEIVSELVPLATHDRIEVLKFRDELNRQYRDSSDSPLSEKDRNAFIQHDFYPYQAKYRVKARLELTPNAQTFDMSTSSGKSKKYRTYGIAHFTIDKVEYELEVYESLRLKVLPEYADHLFLPFKDLTTGISTYGTGRFLDLTKSLGETLIIDFNQCYNPYCAYSDGYSCPITPSQNFIDITLEAGIIGPIGH